MRSRGNAREPIFLDEQDNREYLSVLASVAERCNWLCHAYCLMTNHYHLMIETPDGKLNAPAHWGLHAAFQPPLWGRRPRTPDRPMRAAAAASMFVSIGIANGAKSSRFLLSLAQEPRRPPAIGLVGRTETRQELLLLAARETGVEIDEDRK